MFDGRPTDEKAFLERISATAIVNRAIMKCSLAGLEITHDNVILFIGDFADPDDVRNYNLIHQIQRSIEDVMTAVVSAKGGRRATQ